jgi:hypothetical protein
VQWIPFIAAAVERLAWEDCYTGTHDEVDYAIQQANELWVALHLGAECAANTGSAGSSNDGGGGTFEDLYSDLLEMMQEVSLRFRLNGKLYVPVIDLVEDPCDTPEVEEKDPDSGTAVPGGSDGGAWGERATLLDLCSNISTTLLGAFENALDRFQNYDFILDTIIPVVDEVTIDNVRDAITEIEAEISDPDFVRAAKKAAVKVFNDPVGRPTRQQLRQFAYRLPLLQGGAPMKAGFTVFAELVNINELTAKLANVAGTGELSGDCALAFQTAGRQPFSPPDTSGEQIFQFGSDNRTAYVITVDTTPSPQTEQVDMHEILGDVVGIASLGWYGINAGGALNVRVNIKQPDGTNVWSGGGNWGHCCNNPIVEKWVENGSLDSATQSVMDAIRAEIAPGATRTTQAAAPTTESVGDTIFGQGTVGNGTVYYDKLIVVYDTSSLST